MTRGSGYDAVASARRSGAATTGIRFRREAVDSAAKGCFRACRPRLHTGDVSPTRATQTVTTLPVLLSTAQIARVLDVRDESSARRAIARWRARGVTTHALPSTGGRRSHGVALADVACMVGLDEADVMRLAGVATVDGVAA